MTSSSSERAIRTAQSWALVGLPALLTLVFVLHFRGFGDFFHFSLRYTPTPPERVVPHLINAANRGPLFHDPHMIAYLSLPLFALCAFGLYAVGKRARPIASLIGLMITVTGTIYMGGLFGMWTAFYRGLGAVDPRYVDGAIATFAAMTRPEGAFYVTTSLAKLTMIGLAIQSLALWGKLAIPKWASIAAAAGSGLFLLFWDLDNWMLIGSLLMLIGFIPVRARLEALLADSPRGLSDSAPIAHAGPSAA